MILNVPLSQIDDNPWQTRHNYDDDYIAELAADIARNGLLQLPNGRLLMRDSGSGLVLNSEQIAKFEIDRHLLNDDDMRVQLAIGHNRVRAYRLLAASDDAFATIPVQVAAYDDQQMACMAWSENEQRRDLSPLEQAQAIAHVITDFDWTHEQTAERFGLSRATITNKLRLLDLPDGIQQHIHAGALSERKAVALLPLYQVPEATQAVLDTPSSPSRMSRKEIVARALDGASSDWIRQWSVAALDGALGRLDGRLFPPGEQVAQGNKQVHHGRCDDCALKIRRENVTYCSDAACYAIKTESWRSYCLTMAGRTFQFPATPPDRPIWYYEGFGDNEVLGKLIVERGCPDNQLRLFHDPGFHNIGVRVQSAPAVRVVCEKGGGRSCVCLSRLRREEAQAQGEDPAAAEERAAKKRLAAEVTGPATSALETALVAMQPEAWRLVVRFLVYLVSESASRELPFEKLCRLLAKKIIEKNTSWQSHVHQGEERRALDELLSAAGIHAYGDSDYSYADDLEQHIQAAEGDLIQAIERGAAEYEQEMAALYEDEEI